MRNKRDICPGCGKWPYHAIVQVRRTSDGAVVAVLDVKRSEWRTKVKDYPRSAHRLLYSESCVFCGRCTPPRTVKRW